MRVHERDIKRNNKIAFKTDIKNLLIRDSVQIGEGLIRQREKRINVSAV